MTSPPELPPLKLRSRRRRFSGRDRVLPEPVVRLLPPTVQPEVREAVVARPVAPAAPIAPIAPVTAARKPPLYWRLLRLRHVHPNGWQRALFVEGALAVALVLVLAGKASSWTLLVLPVLVAVLVKANDLVAGGLRAAPGSDETSQRVNAGGS